MNREIKFRVPHFKFDGKFTHFSYWGTIDNRGIHSPNGDCFSSPGSNNYTTKGWHEQFTGIKDRNGKEIFEGDVLKVFVGFKLEYDSIPVIWNNRFASFELKATGCSLSKYITLSFENPFEVIGNIHENKELIQ